MSASAVCPNCGKRFTVTLGHIVCPYCGWPDKPESKPAVRHSIHVDLPGKLLEQIRLAGLPVPEREYRFHQTRQWRFDLAWPEKMFAVECDGGTFSRGRHTRGVGFQNDCIKCNTAAVMGWKVLRFTTAMVEDGSALCEVEKALKQEGEL